ncbi:cytochrome c [Sulfurimonas lithotrophica]|uniref:Cytochrome c n=1 Tax=Sulfurimonas lithotrophica TaxID=2590022 RepID=A0A5P8P3C5_9BACT|nr:cytochrome c [Sulfurimonas lithotrophica]QFR50263.1 cytochrome c [Sulfurimonas lithotrophica]
MITINRCALAILVCSMPFYAYDVQNGKDLFDSSGCMECHTNEHFKSKNRKAKNYKQLFQNVEACRQSTGADWFDEDRDDVVHYLNKEFYKYDIQK